MTRVIYGAWNNNIANGNWDSFIYGANYKSTVASKTNGGNSFFGQDITILKNPGQELDLGIATGNDEASMNSIEISQRTTGQQPEQKLAVGNLYIYGRPA